MHAQSSFYPQDVKLYIKAGRKLSDHLIQPSHMKTKGQGQGSDLLKATEQVCDRVGWSVPSPKLALSSVLLATLWSPKEKPIV